MISGSWNQLHEDGVNILLHTLMGSAPGKFQGVSFKLADMALEIELARLMVYKAAWLLEQKERHI